MTPEEKLSVLCNQAPITDSVVNFFNTITPTKSEYPHFMTDDDKDLILKLFEQISLIQNDKPQHNIIYTLINLLSQLSPTALIRTLIFLDQQHAELSH